jgi:hypothetical protein
MLTEFQERLLVKAHALGMGYEKFAANIRKQGWCSPKQEETLANMVALGESRQRNWKHPSERRSSRRLAYKHNISDCEAMQSGDFF